MRGNRNHQMIANDAGALELATPARSSPSAVRDTLPTGETAAAPTLHRLVWSVRQTLQRSRSLRKAVNTARHLMTTKNDLMNQRYFPEEEFSAQLRRHLIDLIETKGRDNIGDYLEFGVFNGASLSYAYRVFQDLGLDHVRFFGFDSFEGLPREADVDDEGRWLPGMCHCPIEVTQELLSQCGVDWDRTFLVKGWFKDTLTPTVVTRLEIVKASVIMVDCDIYSSALKCLNFVEPLIEDEAVLMFDEWDAFGSLAAKNLGEKLAFTEWCMTHPDMVAHQSGQYHDESMIFRVERSPQPSHRAPRAPSWPSSPQPCEVSPRRA